MKRAVIAALGLTMMITSPVHATTCHELAMSYILNDQDLPQEPGDYLYTEKDENGRFPQLLETTAYCEGSRGCKGDKMRRGYVAYTRNSYGYAVQLYKAIKSDSGYEMGDYLGLYEVKDCGYGRSTGEGKSEVRPDQKHEGTIEAGKTVDTYFPSYSECVDWMAETGGMVFAVVIPAKG